MKKAVFISTAIFFFGITLALFSCEKERDNVTHPVTSELSVADQVGQSAATQEGVEDRSNSASCFCAETGCNGPADMTLTIVSIEGNVPVNFTLGRSCGPIFSDCLTATNIVPNTTYTTPIAYSVGPTPIPPSQYPVRYILGASFGPSLVKRSCKIRVNAPGINNQVFSFTPTSGSVNLYPNYTACF